MILDWVGHILQRAGGPQIRKAVGCLVRGSSPCWAIFFKNKSLLRERARTVQTVPPGMLYLIDLLISEAKICMELGLTGNPFAFTPLGSFLRAW